MMPTPARHIANSSADLSVGARKTGRRLAAEDRRRRGNAEVNGKVSTEPLAAGEAEPANSGLSRIVDLPTMPFSHSSCPIQTLSI